MNASVNRAQDVNRTHGLNITGYQCPSCKMIAWHSSGFETEVFCPFCNQVLPHYVTQISPQRMIKMNATDQSSVERQPNNSTRRNDVCSRAEEERMSPFELEFFMVQGSGFICMAYCNHDGKWRGAFDNMELPGAIRVLE
jgi:uncharacterized Zn finger protein (UPF0148 family)